MPEVKLLPKFLTKSVAKNAICAAITAVTVTTISQDIKRPAFHIVVLVPEILADSEKYPNYPHCPHLLAEYSHGKDSWSRNYAEIALSKALQHWYGCADGNTDIKPHLLFQGETPYWGSVKRDGIVVACSGVQPYFDRMIAGFVADICIAYAYHAWTTSPDKEKGVDFLT